MNQPILKYSNEIRSAVLIIHGEKAHSYYFGKDAYEAMIKSSKYAANKELLTIPDAVHTDLYDNLDVIPFDKMQVTVQNPSGSMTNCCAKQRIEKIFSALNCCCFVDKNDDLLSIYPPCG